MNHLILTLTLAFGTVGCAIGRNFPSPSPDELVPGRTTDQAVKSLMGSPAVTNEIGWNEHQLTQWFYMYGLKSSGDALTPGTSPSRGVDLYFQSGVLVGYDRWSSFKTGATDFDVREFEKRAQAAAPNRSTIQTLLGPPTGRYAYPMVKTPGYEGWTYTYLHTMGTRIQRKHLVITLDPEGRMVDREYRSIGIR